MTESCPNISRRIVRPVPVPGKLDWQKIPDEVFIRAETLRLKIEQDPQTRMAFPLFETVRRIDNRLLSVSRSLSAFVEDQMREEAQMREATLHATRQIRIIPGSSVEYSMRALSEIGAEYNQIHADLSRRLRNPLQASAYRDLEANFDELVGLAMPPYEPWDSAPHLADRALFDESLLQLLQSKNPLVLG